MKISVCVKEAKDAEEANALCKRLPAYQVILRDYPSSKFDRKHVKTTLDPLARVWLVEFEVTPQLDMQPIARY